jgi:hypothetical protein
MGRTGRCRRARVTYPFRSWRTIALGSLLAVVLTVGTLAGWLRFRDPVGALPQEVSEGLPGVEEVVEHRWGRLLTRITLEERAVGTVRFFVSRPDPMRTQRIPLMVVVAGRRTGTEELSLGEAAPARVRRRRQQIVARRPGRDRAV